MSNNPFDSPDSMLLELTQEALRKWKKAENSCRRDEAVELLRMRNKVRALALRSIYMALHEEVRKRKLQLNQRQLLERIVFPSLEEPIDNV